MRGGAARLERRTGRAREIHAHSFVKRHLHTVLHDIGGSEHARRSPASSIPSRSGPRAVEKCSVRVNFSPWPVGLVEYGRTLPSGGVAAWSGCETARLSLHKGQDARARDFELVVRQVDLTVARD